MPYDFEMYEDDIIRAGMFEDECDKADAIANDEAQALAAAEKIHHDQQIDQFNGEGLANEDRADEGYDPEWDLYHDRYDDDPNPYHGTYSEE